jgi:hypothetical protein
VKVVVPEVKLLLFLASPGDGGRSVTKELVDDFVAIRHGIRPSL